MSIAEFSDDSHMPYPGGKGRLVQRLVSLMPPHRAFIETHLGGGAILRHKRPADVNIGIDLDPEIIASWRGHAPSHVSLLNVDAVEFLKSYAFSGDELIFCDPPYLPSTRRRARVYRFDYDRDDHIALLECLGQLPCCVMLCGYRSPLYDTRLAEWNRLDFATRTQAGPAVESVWLNYDPPNLIHDHNHLGATFRERESIRRRRAGLLRRIHGLTPVERNALLAEIAHGDPHGFLAVAEMLR